jgi:hypothetical protein
MARVPEQSERPEHGGWSIVAQDDTAGNWYSLSLNGFYLRYPLLLKRCVPPRDFSEEPPEVVEAWRVPRRYGQELQVVEHDLTECINHMKTDYETIYGHESLQGKSLHLKRFSIIYHIDNFYVRVHKLINNLYTLMSLMVGLQPRKGESRGEFKTQREDLGRALRRRGIATMAELLDGFERNPLIVRAREARNLFVHGYGAELVPKWEATLGVEARLGGDVSEGDEIGRLIRQITQDEDLTRFGDERADELLQTLMVIRDFRDRLYAASQEALINRAAKWPREAQEFAHYISGRLWEEWLQALPDDPEFDRLGQKIDSILKRLKKGTEPDEGSALC